MTVYEVFNSEPESIIDLKQKTEGFIAKGLSLYRIAEFDEAAAHFQSALSVYPQDRVPAKYARLCEKAKARKVNPATWKGVIQVAHK